MRNKLVLAALLLTSNIGPSADAAQPSNTIICICNYASHLMVVHKEKESAELLEQVFKRQPDFELARENLAIAYNNLSQADKNPDERIAYIHKALAITPDDANALRGLDYLLSKAKVSVDSAAAREKYADSLRQKGDEVGAYAEYHIALKEDPLAQGKIDDLATNAQRSRASAVGGLGAAILLDEIKLDNTRNATFNFQYDPYVRNVMRRVRAVWKAPPTLGDRKVQISFDVRTTGAISTPNVSSTCGDKAIDAYALTAVKNASPFKPPGADIFFDVPVTISLDSRSDEAPTLYLNGVAKPDGLTFSTGARLAPLRIPKGVDAKLQAKADAGLSQATKVDQEVAKLEQQAGAESPKLCLLLRASASAYFQANEYQLAEDRLKRALAIAQKANNEGEQAADLSQLGSLYYTTSKNVDAETALKQSIDLMEKTPLADPGLMHKTMEAYAKVLYKLNRVPEADQLYAKMRLLPASASK